MPASNRMAFLGEHKRWIGSTNASYSSLVLSTAEPHLEVPAIFLLVVGLIVPLREDKSPKPIILGQVSKRLDTSSTPEKIPQKQLLVRMPG